MSDELNTHYIKAGFASADEIVLCTEKRTRTLFRPALHKGGVRGLIVRQKIGKDGEWADFNEIDFRSMPPDSGVAIEIDTTATQILADALERLYAVQGKGVEQGDQKYVVAKDGEVIIVDDASKKKAIQELIDQGHSKELWDALAAKDPDLAIKLAAGQVIYERIKVIDEMRESINTMPDDEDYWQAFFEKHSWILQYAFPAPVHQLNGETYLGGKGAVGRGGSGGIATDFLFADASTKNFAVVEIKTPGTKLVGSLYRGKRGTSATNELYSMHSHLSGSVVQVKTQITAAVEHFQSVLGPTFPEKINRVHPTGVLLIGILKGVPDKEQNSFNHFRRGNHDVSILTYDELLLRLEIVFDLT